MKNLYALMFFVFSFFLFYSSTTIAQCVVSSTDFPFNTPIIQSQASDNAVQSRSVTKLRTVVHMVYYHEWDDLSDTEIEEFMRKVNEDFRRQNPDTVYTPDAFKPVAADTEIEFELATVDPTGAPTNGITHTQTPNDNPDLTMNSILEWVLYDSTGGKSAWDPAHYVNIWLVSHTVFEWPGTTFFNHDENRAGMIVSTKTPEFNRVITHQLGHYLGLAHCWGFDGNCPTAPQPGGKDGLADTPDQLYPTTGCPDFPLTDICTPDFPGVMFMNYMDYSAPDCKNMFTKDQAARMNLYIDSLYSSLLDPVSPILDHEPPNSFEVVLYPNPAKEILTAEIRGPFAVEKQYTLFDGTGRIMWERTVDLPSIEKDVFEVGDLSKGIYWLKVEFGGQVELKRFVKL